MDNKISSTNDYIYSHAEVPLKSETELGRKIRLAREENRRNENAKELKSQRNLEKFLRNKVSDLKIVERKLIKNAKKTGDSYLKLCEIPEDSWWNGYTSLNGIDKILEDINKTLDNIELSTLSHLRWSFLSEKDVLRPFLYVRSKPLIN